MAPNPPMKSGEQKSSATQKPISSSSVTPQADGFKIKGTMKTQPKDIVGILRSISFLEIAPEKNAVNVVYVESKDINRNPYLFSILKFKEDELEVIYSIPPEIGPKKRRLDVLAYLLNLLSLVEPYYSVDNKAIYQLIEHAVKELAGSVSMDYTKLYTAYDSIRKEVDDYKKRVDRLTEQTQVLTAKNYELKSMNDDLRLRLQALDSLSDEVLKAKLQEWILEHHGSINVIEFSRVYKVVEARVEDMLNRLVSEGFLELAQ